MVFEGFPAGASRFYERLEADNSRTFWDDHKDDYQLPAVSPPDA